MLQHTFQHIQGIGKKTESDLWEAGIHSWNDIYMNSTTLPAKTLGKIRTAIDESVQQLNHNNTPAYFYKLMPSKIHWRLFPDFIDSAVFLDIETTGLEYGSSEITTIALYDGSSIRHYTNGINLSDFQHDIFEYELIITYNGKTFDIPFIEKFFNITIPHAHIDLRYVLAGLGYRGGLKGCEKAFGIDRQELDGVDGYFAVLLWQDYINNNNPKALETLLAYNIADVVNLDYLMISACNIMSETTPFNYPEIPTRQAPSSPFKADMATVERLRNSFYQNQYYRH